MLHVTVFLNAFEDAGSYAWDNGTMSLVALSKLNFILNKCG
jgi:hypothetical protein